LIHAVSDSAHDAVTGVGPRFVDDMANNVMQRAGSTRPAADHERYVGSWGARNTRSGREGGCPVTATKEACDDRAC
jgi:hypothetical protein